MAPPDPKVSSTSPSTDSDTSPSRLERHLRRKITKHVVERKRRDRINHSLDTLRTLVLEALNKSPEQYSTMEKADILDMTVKYLKLMRTRSRHHGANPAYDTANYNVGHRACAAEVARHLASTAIPDDMKTKLMSNITHTATNPVAPSVTCPTHGLGYPADHTATPAGWRGVPAQAHQHVLPVVPSPQYVGFQGMPFRVPATPTTPAHPRDLKMNIVGMHSANQNFSTPVDNARFHTQRHPSAEAATGSTTTSASSGFTHPLQLNLSLNFGSHGSSQGRPTNAENDIKEEDDMWRPW